MWYGRMCSSNVAFLDMNISWELRSNIIEPFKPIAYPKNKDFLVPQASFVIWF